MTETKTIATQLVELRVTLGMSQRDVARRAGVTPDALSKWERGYYRPDDANLAKWASALGMRLRVSRTLEPMEAPHPDK
jgi:transcriptional regulator with XRE-family HTH domain